MVLPLLLQWESTRGSNSVRLALANIQYETPGRRLPGTGACGRNRQLDRDASHQVTNGSICKQSIYYYSHTKREDQNNQSWGNGRLWRKWECAIKNRKRHMNEKNGFGHGVGLQCEFKNNCFYLVDQTKWAEEWRKMDWTALGVVIKWEIIPLNLFSAASGSGWSSSPAEDEIGRGSRRAFRRRGRICADGQSRQTDYGTSRRECRNRNGFEKNENFTGPITAPHSSVYRKMWSIGISPFSSTISLQVLELADVHEYSWFIFKSCSNSFFFLSL